MKYTKEQRLDIGRRIYTREISKADAMAQYEISKSCAEGYATDYKRAHGIPVKQHKSIPAVAIGSGSDGDMESYQSMSKEELIQALIQSKANELRAKKGYEVKGGGQNKEFISLNSKNSN